MMKLLNRCLFLLPLLLLGGGVGVGYAQTTCTISAPPANGCTFQAFDAQSTGGAEVDAFCVGQPVRFASCAGRVLTGFARYGVRRGGNNPYVNAAGQCDPTLGQPNTYTAQDAYTPQPGDVGEVTVSELTNLNGFPFYYIRTFRVYGIAPPAFVVAPCPSGFVALTITDTTYDTYTVEIVGPSSTTTDQATRGQPVPPLAVPAGATEVRLTGHYNAFRACASTVGRQPIPAIPAPVKPVLNSLTQLGPLPGSMVTFVVSSLPGGYRYDLQIADVSAPGGFRAVLNVPSGSSTLTQQAIAPGCYRLLRTDACNLLPDVSNTVCTVGLSGSSALNINRLTLSTGADPATTYTVARTPAAATPLAVVGGVVNDADVQCGSTYTYRVTATQPGGGVAVSNEVAIVTQSALPPRAPQLVASFNLNNVVVLTPLPAVPLIAGNSLRYRRSAGGRPAEDFGGVATTARPLRDSTDLGQLRAAPPCYTVRLTDVCGNASGESVPACPALLAAAPLAADGSTVTLTWSAFGGPDPAQPARYVLQRLGPDGAVLSAVPVQGNSYDDLLPPTDRQTLRYRLQIAGAGLPAGTFSYSNLATLTRRLLVTIPNAFTPNGDGRNDVLEVKGKYLSGYTFVVVDRNGQEVFRGMQRSDTWDGTIRGHAPVLGVYVWRFQQPDDGGKPYSATGSVTILK